MAVAISLQIGDAGTNVSLTSSGVRVLEYPMNAPDINQGVLQSLGDGNTLGVPSFSNVTESLDLHISDSTAALVAAKIQSIERLLDLARQGSLGYLDDRVYLRIQFDNDSLVWRSQILAAKLELPEGSNQIWRKYVKATLIITRRYYFEAESMQAVEVTSGTTTTATTGYATVYNSDDTHATQRNWWQVAAAQVTGSLPAPAKLYIKNTSGATRAFGTAYLGNYVFNDPASVDPIFRSNDAAGSDTTPGPGETTIYHWSLASGGLIDDFAGQQGRFVVVWSDRPAADNLVRAAVQYRFPSPVFDLALGEQMLDNPNEFAQDLGALPIPPGGYVSGMGDNFYLALKSLPAAGGTDTLGVDWLQIFPTGVGRYRVIKGITNFSLSTNEEVIDDGPNNVCYALSGSDAHPLFRPLHTPLHLWPGRINRMRLIISGGSSFEADNTWGVKMEYKPRRLSF